MLSEERETSAMIFISIAPWTQAAEKVISDRLEQKVERIAKYCSNSKLSDDQQAAAAHSLRRTCDWRAIKIYCNAISNESITILMT